MFKKIFQNISKFFDKPRPEEIICCQVGNNIKVVCDGQVLYEGPISLMPDEVRGKIRQFKAYENLGSMNIYDIFKF